jgi:hypothetical protein
LDGVAQILDILGVRRATDYSHLDMLELWATYKIDDIAAQSAHETLLATEPMNGSAAILPISE